MTIQVGLRIVQLKSHSDRCRLGGSIGCSVKAQNQSACRKCHDIVTMSWCCVKRSSSSCSSKNSCIVKMGCSKLSPIHSVPALISETQSHDSCRQLRWIVLFKVLRTNEPARKLPLIQNVLDRRLTVLLFYILHSLKQLNFHVKLKIFVANICLNARRSPQKRLRRLRKHSPGVNLCYCTLQKRNGLTYPTSLDSQTIFTPQPGAPAHVEDPVENALYPFQPAMNQESDQMDTTDITK